MDSTALTPQQVEQVAEAFAAWLEAALEVVSDSRQDNNQNTPPGRHFGRVVAMVGTGRGDAISIRAKKET